jgi:methionine synthase I (cobalamin-dependent)
MSLLIEQLTSSGPVLADGAWGTQLQALGLEAGACPDLWNLSHPDRVEAVASGYVQAGSRVILTNTFRANRLVLGGDMAAVNRAGVAISRRAADTQAAVFASIGPSGRLLAAGEISAQELYDVFLEQALALAAGGADALLLETISDLAEARVAIAAARVTQLPIVVSMVFDTGRNHDRTITGVTPEQAAAELTAAGADVIGANCGVGIAAYVPICRRLRAATNRPIWIKPNAGLPELVDGRVVYRTSPEEFAGHAPALVGAGASFVGGCCGTTPAYIRALGEALRCA